MQLKVLSWNIWIDGNFKQLVDFLEAQDADVIGLQEVKDDDTEHPVLAFLQNHGYQYVFMPVEKKFKDKVYRDGPAVFSKFPIISSQTHNLSREDNRGAAQADIQVNGKILHVFSTHFLHTHQKPSKNQDEQADTLFTLLPQAHTIIMGDFNATPESYPIQKLSSVLKNTDTSNAPTWSMYPEGCPACSPQSVDTRLDYIFVSKDLETTDAKVGKSGASDHLPISVMVEI